MPKKSEPNHGHKGNSSGHAQKLVREESSEKENPSIQRHARKQGRKEGSGNGSNYRQQIKAKKLAEGEAKDGCLPKLFMLLLPFAAIGAYLLYSS